MRVSSAGLELIKKYEGCKLHAYKCPAGVLTIGYGWTEGVKKGDVITQEHAEELLERGLAKYESAVWEAIRRAQPKTKQHQFDAMVCLTYNIGIGAFARSSVLRHHLAGETVQAGNAFLLWDKAGGKELEGLKRRREAERRLYTGTGEP